MGQSKELALAMIDEETQGASTLTFDLEGQVQGHPKYDHLIEHEQYYRGRTCF